MTTEEKAKRYEEALERAKKVLETDLHESGVWAIKKIFPELKESEDERIRKELFAVINDLVLPDEQKARFNSWLEKQSEKKPEVKHIGWVARDSEHNPYLGLGLVLFKGKPIRSGDCWTGVIDSQLPWESFPDLKWEDEPVEVEVEVTIRRK